MDALARPQHHPLVRVLLHIKRLDDCFGDFLVRFTCPVRNIAAHRAGGTRADRGTLGDTRRPGIADAVLAVREEGRRGGGGGEAEARGMAKN